MSQFASQTVGGSVTSPAFARPDKGKVIAVRNSPGPHHLMRFDVEAIGEAGTEIQFFNVTNSGRLDPSIDYAGPAVNDPCDIYWKGALPVFVIQCYAKTTDCGGGA